ncbi:hypothetical protein Tco_0789052 [Tanacetum coccineum]
MRIMKNHTTELPGMPNAEDNEYPEGVNQSLEFVITSKDITNTGAPATLLVFNKEKGFPICSVGRFYKERAPWAWLYRGKSNGYQIRFNDKPCEHCNVGYIVPEWVEDDTVLSAIKGVYGSATNLPTTTLVFPLKPEKVIPVKKQLSSVHPEALLFLSKIKRLSVREQNDDPSLNTVSAISISSETNFVTSKSMWKQRFPVKQENKVDTRQEVEEWITHRAIPIVQNPKNHQAFLNILWDNKWNQGILNCVPDAFLNAFTSLVKSTENAPVSSLANMFWFLPFITSNLRHQQLSRVRRAIQVKLKDHPMRQNVSLHNISSHGTFILNSSFDKETYNNILNFLEIKYVDDEWYAKCISGSNLVTGVSEDVYSELLVFIAENWESFQETNIIISNIQQNITIGNG